MWLGAGVLLRACRQGLAGCAPLNPRHRGTGLSGPGAGRLPRRPFPPVRRKRSRGQRWRGWAACCVPGRMPCREPWQPAMTAVSARGSEARWPSGQRLALGPSLWWDSPGLPCPEAGCQAPWGCWDGGVHLNPLLALTEEQGRGRRRLNVSCFTRSKRHRWGRVDVGSGAGGVGASVFRGTGPANCPAPHFNLTPEAVWGALLALVTSRGPAASQPLQAPILGGMLISEDLLASSHSAAQLLTGSPAFIPQTGMWNRFVKEQPALAWAAISGNGLFVETER